MAESTACKKTHTQPEKIPGEFQLQVSRHAVYSWRRTDGGIEMVELMSKEVITVRLRRRVSLRWSDR